MKKIIQTATMVALFLVFSISAKSQSAGCSNCFTQLTGCVNAIGGVVTFYNILEGVLIPIQVSGTAAAGGCVTAYNTCVTNNNCFQYYPLAVVQVTTPSIKRVISKRPRRG